jgi:hypothetical protein
LELLTLPFGKFEDFFAHSPKRGQYFSLAQNSQVSHLCLRLIYFPPDLVVKTARNQSWNNKWGDEAVLKNILTTGNDYFNELARSFGKQIISLEEKVVVDSVVDSLKNHEATKDLFSNDEPNFYIIYQKPFYTLVDGVKCKILPDIIVVDSAGNLTMYDVKTMASSVLSFPDQAQKFRYDLQAAFYLDVISRYLTINQQEITVDMPLDMPEGYDNEYEIPPNILHIKVNAVVGFRFIVESKSSAGTPVIYHASPNFINMGKIGRERVFFKASDDTKLTELSFSPVFGYQYLLELYKWHLENGFEIDRVIKMTDHNLNLDWNIKPL